MKSLLIALSFVGFASSASTVDLLVSCTDRNPDSNIQMLTISRNNLQELVAQVVLKNNFMIYKVESEPAMLGGTYYASLFDTYKFEGVNSDFKLELCVSAGCTRYDYGARPGKIAGLTLDEVRAGYSSDTLNCISDYTSQSK